MKRILDFVLGMAVGAGALGWAADIEFKTETTTQVAIEPTVVEFTLSAAQNATFTTPAGSWTIAGQAGKTVTGSATLRAKAQ